MNQAIIIKITKDGDQYCALMGENLQEGLAGFGNTPTEALSNLISEIENDPMVCNTMIDTLGGKHDT